MTWTWKCGTSWNATSPSATNRFTPAAASVWRTSAASLRATLNVRMAAVSFRSAIRTACSRGTTSMWPCVIGWTSMNATTLSSWYVKLAGDSPRRISQKTHWPLNSTRSLIGRSGIGVGLSIDRGGLGLERRLTVGRSLGAGGFEQRFRAVRRHLRLAVRGALHRGATATPAPRPAVTAVRPGQALDLGADAHALARRHHRADPGHQALVLAVLEKRAEQLGRAAYDRLG